jgi:hypothetical protein
MKAENDSPYCLSWLGMPICYFTSISSFLYISINNCVHIMFKIRYMTMIAYYLLLCAVHIRKCCGGTIILPGKDENPALVLSNVHKRTSAPDCALFGSIGISMYTASLVEFRTHSYILLHWEAYNKGSFVGHWL